MNDCTLCKGPCRATEARRIMDTVPIETQRLLWAGKLSMTCPTCGDIEPAGLRCSKCGGLVLPEHWRQPEATDTQREALRAARLAKSRPAKDLKAA